MSHRRNRKRPLKPQGPPPKHLSKEWYKSYPRKDRNSFKSVWGIFIILFGFDLMSILHLVNNSDYYHLQDGIFYGCLIVFLLSILQRKNMKHILASFKKVFTDFQDMGLNEMQDASFLLLMALAAVTLLFILDYSFFVNYGFRIGAVAAVGLYHVIVPLIQSFRKKQQVRK